MNDEPFNADAVLTSVLAEQHSVKRATARRVMMHVQDTTHPDTDVSIEVGTRQDHSRVLSSQFQSQWSHVVRGSKCDLASNFLGSNERDVFDDR